MSLPLSLKRYRFPVGIISQAVWLYHCFNHSLRDVSEQLAYRGMEVSYETIRSWGVEFAQHFKDVIKKRERKPSDKWHLDERVRECLLFCGVPWMLKGMNSMFFSKKGTIKPQLSDS